MSLFSQYLANQHINGCLDILSWNKRKYFMNKGMCCEVVLFRSVRGLCRGACGCTVGRDDWGKTQKHQRRVDRRAPVQRHPGVNKPSWPADVR